VVIVMNVVSVQDGRTDEFERTFHDRNSHLDGVEGFLQFQLLRRDETDEYSVVTLWESEEHFEEWVASDRFFDAHRPRDHTLSRLVEMRTYSVIKTEKPARA
jgi:heme-degrading monooxygenase HmoA